MSHSAIATASLAHLARQGTALAGVLGAVGACIGAAWLFGGLARDPSQLALSLGLIVGAGVGFALSWRLLVPRGGRFSLPMAVLAGIAGAVVAHIVPWFAFFVTGSIIAAESLPDMARAFGFTVTMLGMSLILAGMVTIPVGIAITVLVTLWCRWRLAG